VHFINGRYCLYYSASSFGSQRALIGLATNATLNPADPNCKWVDEGKVIESREGMGYNAIDAAVVTDTEGGVWMTFGSFWGGIMMIELHPETGKPFSDKPEVISLARRESPPNAIEAPYIIHRQGYYYLFVSFDNCCRGAESTYKIMIGRSRNVTGPYVDAEGREMLKGGGTLVLEGDDRWKGPGHNSVLSDDGTYYLVHHAYDAENRGRPTLHIRPLKWTEDGWPKAGAPLEGLTLSGAPEPQFPRQGPTPLSPGSP
jgi:arabinan endo-1,5-alpha-L-arabinosidase